MIAVKIKDLIVESPHFDTEVSDIDPWMSECVLIAASGSRYSTGPLPSKEASDFAARVEAEVSRPKYVR